MYFWVRWREVVVDCIVTSPKVLLSHLTQSPVMWCQNFPSSQAPLTLEVSGAGVVTVGLEAGLCVGLGVGLGKEWNTFIGQDSWRWSHPKPYLLLYAVSIMGKGWLPCTERISYVRWHQQYNDPTHNWFFLFLPAYDAVSLWYWNRQHAPRSASCLSFFCRFLSFKWISEFKCSTLRWWWTSAN